MAIYLDGGVIFKQFDRQGFFLSSGGPVSVFFSVEVDCLLVANTGDDKLSD